jgi:phosphoribosyl 1,2-cyclic phosphodiesterase
MRNLLERFSEGFCPLASGSKGNCIYIGSKKTKILVDAGISAKAICERLAELQVDIRQIDAVLISHEHIDHIQAIKVLVSKYQIPIIANRETARAIVQRFQITPRFKIFMTGETFEFGDFEIHPFTIQHDAQDPVGFTITYNGIKIGISTDLGFVTTLVANRLENCDLLYVEANHKPSMVHASNRPLIYKQRVLSRTGHLSNEACGELLLQVAHEKLQQVYLAHLSSECNTPQVALETVESILKQHNIKLSITVAHQEQSSTPLIFH